MKRAKRVWNKQITVDNSLTLAPTIYELLRQTNNLERCLVAEGFKQKGYTEPLRMILTSTILVNWATQYSGGRTLEVWLEVMNRLRSKLEQADTFKELRISKAAMGNSKLQSCMASFMALCRSVRETALTTVGQHKYMQVPATVDPESSSTATAKPQNKYRYAHWSAAL